MSPREPGISPAPRGTWLELDRARFWPRIRELDRPGDEPKTFADRKHAAVNDYRRVRVRFAGLEAAGIVREDLAGAFNRMSRAEPHDRRVIFAELRETPIALFLRIERFHLEIVSHAAGRYFRSKTSFGFR